MNFLPGRIALGADGPAFQSPALSAASRLSVRAGPVDAAPVELGVRPEHVVLAAGCSRCAEDGVEMTEPMGSDLLAWTRAGDARAAVDPAAGRDAADVRRAPARPIPPEHCLSLFDTCASGNWR